MKSRYAALAALVAVAFPAAADAAPSFHLSDLGMAWYGYGLGGLNNRGDAAGTSTEGHVLLYHADTGVTEDKGTAGGDYAVVTGINDQQVIVGYATINNVLGATPFAMAGSGIRFGPSSGLPVGGINDAGVIAVMANGLGALVDTRTQQVTSIGSLPGGKGSQPAAISADNGITGASRIGKVSHAFYWHDGQLSDLGTLVEGGNSAGASVNASGTVVGSADVTTGRKPTSHAFIASVGTGMRDLLPDMGNSQATGVNATGHVVGNAATAKGLPFSFYYDGAQAYALADLVDASAAGWALYRAYFINDADQILGIGAVNGQYHAYLLTPTAR